MNNTVIIPQKTATLAAAMLGEHATLLEKQGLTASASVARSLADYFAEEIALQQPQTLEQQIAVLTEVFGCGPDPDFNK